MAANNYPKLHNAAWPGIVGKGAPDSEPIIALDTLLRLTANAEVDAGKYELARTSLAELKTLLASESALVEIAQSVDRQIEVVESALRERDEIAATAARFAQFEKLVDATRALGSLLELDNIDDDAKQAMRSGKQALALFLRFHTFGHHFQSQGIRQGEHRTDDRSTGCRPARLQTCDERAVDLRGVQREAVQITQR